MKKVLLDESLPRKLKAYLTDICEPLTVSEMGWKAKTNGELLSLAVESSFEFFLIVDKNLAHQQNLSNYKIKVVLLDSYRNTIEVLSPFILEFKKLIIEERITEAYTVIKLSQSQNPI
ncbi:MAG: hypothetical protein JJT78_09165 [Leptospira sp.]|nr:hypothetical protein [Leptospira sp.]